MVLQVHLDPLDLLVLLDLWGLRAIPGLLALAAPQVQLDQLVTRVLLVLAAQLDLQDPQDQLVTSVLRDQLVILGQQVQLDPQDRLDLLGLIPL